MQNARSEQLSFEARRALGGLLTMIDDPYLRDAFLQVRDGSGELWIDRGGGLEAVHNWRAPPEQVEQLARRLIAAGGRHIDELSPCADVHLGGGIRVHAVLPPLCVNGAAISMRFPRTDPLSFQKLIAGGLCDAKTARIMRAAVRDRKNFLVTGATGSGKTTVLGALLGTVAENERIITIEDLNELQPVHPHHVALESRAKSAEGSGEYSLDALLRQALRMRPDRLVLGECRGAEVVTLFSALNTGHDGGAGTLHASSLADVPARLEALGLLAGLSAEAVARQAAAAIHLVIHLERAADGLHRVAALGCLYLEDGLLAVRRYG